MWKFLKGWDCRDFSGEARVVIGRNKPVITLTDSFKIHLLYFKHCIFKVRILTLIQEDADIAIHGLSMLIWFRWTNAIRVTPTNTIIVTRYIYSKTKALTYRQWRKGAQVPIFVMATSIWSVSCCRRKSVCWFHECEWAHHWCLFQPTV